MKTLDAYKTWPTWYQTRVNQPFAIHEAGHAIATLDIGCLLYECYIGVHLSRTVKGATSGGSIYRGTDTPRQSAVIAVSGAMSDFLHKDKVVNMDQFLHAFENEYRYSHDLTLSRKERFPLLNAALESKYVLLKRWRHLEFLIEKLSKPENQNRWIKAGELFQMAGCRLLDSRQLPVAKRKVYGRLIRLSDQGWHQWRDLKSYSINT
jgi:hypothetical protein